MKKQTLNEQLSRIKEMMSKLVNENLNGASGWEGGVGDREPYENPDFGWGPMKQKPTYTEENKEAVDFLENLIKNHHKDLRYDEISYDGKVKSPNGYEFERWDVSIFKVGADGLSMGLGVAYNKNTDVIYPIGLSIYAELENGNVLEYTFKDPDPNVRYFGEGLLELGRYELRDLIKEKKSERRSISMDDHFDDNHDFDREPSDDDIYNRFGREGGISYDTNDNWQGR